MCVYILPPPGEEANERKRFSTTTHLERDARANAALRPLRKRRQRRGSGAARRARRRQPSQAPCAQFQVFNATTRTTTNTKCAALQKVTDRSMRWQQSRRARPHRHPSGSRTRQRHLQACSRIAVAATEVSAINAIEKGDRLFFWNKRPHNTNIQREHSATPNAECNSNEHARKAPIVLAKSLHRAQS